MLGIDADVRVQLEVIAPEDGGDSETLTRNADIAMYAAKGDGRGIHRFFREELLEGAKSRKQLEDDLRGVKRLFGER